MPKVPRGGGKKYSLWRRSRALSSCVQQATMTDDNTPHRVFKISELARLIAGRLTLIGRGSAVSLARTCRCLEEPVLSTLWETQSSLHTLLKVLPKGTRYTERPAPCEYVVRDLDHLSGKSIAQV